VAVPAANAAKAGSLGRTLTALKENEDYEPADRNEQVAAAIMEQKSLDTVDRTVVVNWPIYREKKQMVRKTLQDGSVDYKSKPTYVSTGEWQDSRLSLFQPSEFLETMQKGLENFCSQMQPPPGYQKYKAPKIVAVPSGGFKPQPNRRSSNQAQAYVVFESAHDAERLLAEYGGLAKPHVDLNVALDTEQPEIERVFVKALKVAHDHHSDTASLAETHNSNATHVHAEPAGNQPKKDLLLASGIPAEVWKSSSWRWYAHDAIQASAEQVCSAYGIEAPHVSFDHPKHAPEGAICMNFSSYDQAKTFRDKEKEHPVGLRSGPVRLNLYWARRPKKGEDVASAKAKAAPVAKRY
jgi:hypothetical protein